MKKFSQLNEVKVKDWDGKQFTADYGWNDDQTDDEAFIRQNGLSVIGYMDGKWRVSIKTIKDTVGKNDHLVIISNDRFIATADHVALAADNDTRMTNLELAKWLSGGNGQVLNPASGYISNFHSYKPDDNGDIKPVASQLRVRKYGADSWVEPTNDLCKDT